VFVSVAHGAARVVTSSLVKMRLVWVRSVLRETYSSRDLRPGQFAVEEPEHLQLPPAQRTGRALRRLGRRRRCPCSIEEASDAVDAGSVVQEDQHRGALVEVQPNVALRLRSLGEASAQHGESLREVAEGMVGKGQQRTDLEQAAVPPGGRGSGVQPVEKTQPGSQRGRPWYVVEAPFGPVLGGAVLGEQEPREGEVLVLVQVVGSSSTVMPPSSARWTAADRSPSAIRMRVRMAAMRRMSG
jgi:hypothetical protein